MNLFRLHLSSSGPNW